MIKGRYAAQSKGPGLGGTGTPRVFRAGSGRRYPPTMRHDDPPGVSRRHLDARERPDDVSEAMIGFIRELD